MFLEKRAQPTDLCLAQALMLHEVHEQTIARAAKELSGQCRNRAMASTLARHAGRVAVRASDLRSFHASLALESAQYGKYRGVRQFISETRVHLCHGAGTAFPQHIHQICFAIRQAHSAISITIDIVIGSKIQAACQVKNGQG